MASSLSQGQDERILNWVQEVNGYICQNRQPPSLPKRTSRSSLSGMRLRERPTRNTLAEISVNPQDRKRKTGEAMQGSENVRGGYTAQPAKKRRGRPPGSKKKTVAAVEEESSYQEPMQEPVPPPPVLIPSFPLPSLPSALSPSRSPSRSPTKSSRRGVKTFNMAKPQAQIETKFLESCTPAVFKCTFQQLRANGKTIPQPVIDLYKTLQLSSQAAIPAELKDAYDKDSDTPRKSKEPLHNFEYLQISQTPFSARQLARLKETTDIVLLKASRNDRLQAHERQWGAVVSQVLDEAELWSGGEVALFNVENCAIAPDELKPVRPSGRPIDEDLQSTSTKSEAPDNVNRMIDWSFGLELGWDDKLLIKEAYKRCNDYEHSLNQTLSYIDEYPLFLDIEIKKANASSNPEVQLATWVSAGILKRRHHGWKSNMIPMPAIAVDGHSWFYYIFFELEGKIMMTEPAEFGNTRTLNGIWTIFRRLHVLMSWAETEFMQWVQDAVVGWAKGEIAKRND